MARVKVYVDGFNLYHAIDALENNALKWLSHQTLAKRLLRTNEELTEVNFFTAVLTWNKNKQTRHNNYLAALRATGVKVHEANFKRARRYCQENERYCKFYEEKQTDVAIAVQIVADVTAGSVDQVVLITADSDQIPTAKYVSGCPNARIRLLFPPGRKAQARELGSIITDRKELSVGLLNQCLLPRDVRDSDGRIQATRPAAYAPGA